MRQTAVTSQLFDVNKEFRNVNPPQQKDKA